MTTRCLHIFYGEFQDRSFSVLNRMTIQIMKNLTECINLPFFPSQEQHRAGNSWKTSSENVFSQRSWLTAVSNSDTYSQECTIHLLVAIKTVIWSKTNVRTPTLYTKEGESRKKHTISCYTSKNLTINKWIIIEERKKGIIHWRRDCLSPAHVEINRLFPHMVQLPYLNVTENGNNHQTKIILQ